MKNNMFNGLCPVCHEVIETQHVFSENNQVYLKKGNTASSSITLKTKDQWGTDIEIDRVSSLEIYSSKDEITIEEVGAVHGDLRFTNMQLNNVDEQINLTMKIADFRVSKVQNPDAVIVIDQESSEVSLTISDFSFKFDATLEEGLLRLPKSFKNVETKMLNKGQRIREITATYGKGLSGEISITGIKGVILLKEF